MADISAKMVMDLRKATGVGMMECKKALTEAGGDLEAAQEFLRKAGLAKAAKKADREANEGLIRIRKEGNQHGMMLVVACETDFVAKNADFSGMVDELADFLASADVGDAGGKMLTGDALAPINDMQFKDESIGDTMKSSVAKIGENIYVAAFASEKGTNDGDYLQDYIHGGKVGVLACITTGKADTHNNPRFQEVAKDLAMQIAAGVPTVPLAVDRDGVDPAAAEKEKNFLLDQVKEEGKPEEIAQKIVEGRMSKFYSEVTLLEQPFIKDDKQSVGEMLKAAGEELGDTIEVARFHRYAIGG